MKEKWILAREFREVIKGNNFITPTTLDLIEINNGVAELSEGDFLGDKIYGVTIVLNKAHDFDKSKSFRDKDEAIDYINTLK